MRSGGGKRHAVVPVLNFLLANRHLLGSGRPPTSQHVAFCSEDRTYLSEVICAE